MSGWPLPIGSKHLPTPVPYTYEPDNITFAPGSSIPTNFYTWRYAPANTTFQVSAPNHPYALQVVPSRTNLTGSSESAELSGLHGIAFVARKQEHTLFTYSVDVAFDPFASGQEAGISAFLTQEQHIDLSVRPASSNTTHNERELVLRISAEGANLTSSLNALPVPKSWISGCSITLQVYTANDTHYVFSAWPAGSPNDKLVLGSAPAKVVSGGTGPFTGVLLGVFATCNGGSGSDNTCSDAGGEAYFSNWKYTGAAQKIETNGVIPAVALHEEL